MYNKRKDYNSIKVLMKLSDKFSLVSARLKTRKSRTAITILTMSVLFGVVIAAMTIIQGNFNNLEYLNQEAYGNNIFLKVTYSGEDAEHAEEYIARAVGYLNGQVVGKITHYCSNKQIDIPDLTPYREPFVISAPCSQSYPGEYIEVIDSETISSLIDVRNTNDDSINVILPVATAGKLQSISQPSLANSAVTEYIKNVTNQSVGRKFTATTSEFSVTREEPEEKPANFTIVGLTPSRDVTTFSPDAPTIFSDIMPVENYSPMAIFAVVNPTSSAFQALYNRQSNDRTEYLISFSNVQDALAWLNPKESQKAIPQDFTKYISTGGQEYLTTRISNHQKHQSYNKTITEFSIVFTIISVIIMAGTLSRVIDDEKSSIALYRSIGATTGEILQIFVLYMLVISLLVILCATVIGILISLGVTFIFGGAVTATARSLFLLPNLKLLIMIGFDWKIIFVWLSIIVVSLVSLLAMVKKLVSKDITKDLKR